MRLLPRLVALTFLVGMACQAAAQQRPPRLEPLPEPPPPPPGVISESLDQPVTITPGANDRIEEYLFEGKRTIKVTQPDGKVYYLQEQDVGDSAGPNGLAPRVRAPLWVIKEF